MTDVLTPDLCIIGGGPAGISAALAAAAEGAEVILVEKGRLGGAHINGGGLASKSLVAAAGIRETLRLAPAMGVETGALKVNYGHLQEHVAVVGEAVSERVTPEMLAAKGIRFIAAAARFIDPAIIQAGEEFIRPRRFVLAVGSKPTVLPVPGLENVPFSTIDKGIGTATIQGHLLILGAGPHSLELAQSVSRLGGEVTVLDTGPALAGYDPELSQLVLQRLLAEGITVRQNITIHNVAPYKDGIRFTLTDLADGDDDPTGRITVDGTRLVVACGREPLTEGLDLAAARVKSGPEGILVNRFLRTSNARVYAVGDAVAGHASVARAAWQGAAVARAALSGQRTPDGSLHVPDITFTDPAIATVGLDEDTARKVVSRSVRIYRVPFIDNDRTAIERLPQGLLKVITTRDGRIIGAGIVGRGADEMIALWSLAIANRLSLTAMATLAVGYPTRSDLARQIGLTAAEDEQNGGLTPSWRKRIMRFLGRIG